MQITGGTVFCEDGVFRKTNLNTNGSRIASIGDNNVPLDDKRIDAEGCYVVPGLVDIHIHGAMGADFSDGTTDSIETMARHLLSHGVTSFLGTSMSLPEEQLTQIYQTAKPLVGRACAGRATLRGINMEGPFFNREKRGAQNENHIIDADFSLFCRLNAASGNHIRTVAVAPEINGGMDFIKQAAPLCHVSIAHTCANYDTAKAALYCGANHVTHLFNGMPPFHHRDPGVVGAAVSSRAFVELICDGVHIHPSMVQSVFRLFGADRVCLISDAIRACGMPEGQYDLGGQVVTVAQGCATIGGGSLAGSITVLADCLRNAIQFGIPQEDALKAATITPARSVGMDHLVGSLSVGKCADILLFNPDLSLHSVILAGEMQ